MHADHDRERGLEKYRELGEIGKCVGLMGWGGEMGEMEGMHMHCSSNRIQEKFIGKWS